MSASQFLKKRDNREGVIYKSVEQGVSQKEHFSKE